MQSVPIFYHATVVRCGLIRLVAMLSLLLITLPAVAVDYLFSATSNSFPTSCSYVSEGNYTCDNLTLVAGDTVTMDPNALVTPATINVVGTFVITDAAVNIDGLASDLNIAVVGTVGIGTALVVTNTQVNANVSSMAAINVYSSSIIGGDLSANTPTGIITLATYTWVVGDVHTDAGAITLGIGSHVGGDVFSTGAGVITAATNVSIGGSLSSFSGAISLGIGTQVDGSVSSSGAGVLTLSADVIVGVDVVSAVGGITVGNGSTICGDVGSTGPGVITLTTNVSVGGGVKSVAGAITIGAGSTVQLSIRSIGAGVMTITGVEVGGDLYTFVGAITGTTSRVRGHVTESNIHTYPLWSHQANLVVNEPAACDALLPAPLPDILLLKSVQVYSDPVNLQNNPKAIPGSVMLYTILVTNRGGATNTDTVVITAPMPVNTDFFVNDINGAGSGPLLFTDGTSASGLSYSMESLASTADNISFSTDNGDSFDYTPASVVDYDSAVTDIKVSLSGAFEASSGAPHPSFSISFRVRVE
jgi:hypothetical protein